MTVVTPPRTAAPALVDPVLDPVRDPAPDLAPDPVRDRAAAARAALRAAEQRTGRARAAEPDGRLLPVHPELAALLPGGGLAAGTVLAVRGSTTLLLALLAEASRSGAWVALVGAPTVGMLAAADAGIALGRTVLVPDPGPDAPAAVAALLDGMDVVVVGPRATLLDADRRRLAARSRERGAVLVAQSAWPGAHVTLDARGGTWSGVDHGAGWLRRRTLRVRRTGRGAAARPVEVEVDVPLRVEHVVGGDLVTAGAVATTGESAAAGGGGRARLRVA
ncbi:hypothetical protein [Krasilnikoviella flava]|uniref:Uncharacterized protein n=1 Tax=Krasilnikoviella flava TaxID=526729 RepID=A0A1T5M3D2_9MICO|nr:hypothetical protein [Krasilnikoviella flava]SKC82706.1 hypothetical protein SAMN04324258_4440 [Krasilnikoviella flava]